VLIEAQRPATGLPSVVRWNMARIGGAQVFAGAAGQLTPALGAIIAQRLLDSNVFMGAATAMNGLSRMVISYPLGSLTDRYGRKAGLMVSLLGCSASPCRWASSRIVLVESWSCSGAC